MKIDLLKHIPSRAPTHCDPFDSCACNEDETFHPLAFSAKDIAENCNLIDIELLGNGVCDDKTNNAECGYDMGDCCLEPINDHKCTDCICHEDNTRHVGINSKSSRS